MPLVQFVKDGRFPEVSCVSSSRLLKACMPSHMQGTYRRPEMTGLLLREWEIEGAAKHVARNERLLGPFSKNDLQSRLARLMVKRANWLRRYSSEVTSASWVLRCSLMTWYFISGVWRRWLLLFLTVPFLAQLLYLFAQSGQFLIA